MVQEVADTALGPERVEAHARLLTSADKRLVFEAIYRGVRSRPITAKELVSKINKPGLDLKRVLSLAKPLAGHGLFRQPPGLPVAYERYQSIQASKNAILRKAKQKSTSRDKSTMRSPRSTVKVDVRVRPFADVQALFVAIDDIENFSRVRSLPASKLPKTLPPPLREEVFKYGMANILGNRGHFHDWGGEKNDLFTTHVSLRRKRRPAAFAFKGPAHKGVLRLKSFGSQGNQIQRLFASPVAQLFLAQYEGEIHEEVAEEMQTQAVAKSVAIRGPVFWSLIGREDSARLRLRYKEAFDAAEKAHPPKKAKKKAKI